MGLSKLTIMCVAFKSCAYTAHITLHRRIARENSVGTNVVFVFRTTTPPSNPTTANYYHGGLTSVRVVDAKEDVLAIL